MIDRLETALAPLERTPAVLRAMLAGLDDRWTMANYGEATFSPFDVVGHLLHGERTDWMPRVRHILSGDARPFSPFDRYAMRESSRGQTLGALLDDFDAARAKSLAELRGLGLTADRLGLPGVHPAFGRVTLGQLLAAWVVHDLHHIAQIARGMAFQMKDDVGPWREYLGILPRN